MDSSDDEHSSPRAPTSLPNSSKSNTRNLSIQKIQSSFRINPNEIVFQEAEPNVKYTVIFEIQNTSKRTKRMRVVNPNNRCFSIKCNLEKPLSPGLTLEIEVNFMHASPNVHHDRFIVLSDEEKFEIPIRAYGYLPNLQFNPIMNLGYIVYNSQFVAKLNICNTGKRTGTYTVVSDEDSQLRFRPNSSSLAPGESLEVFVDFPAAKLGTFREVIQFLREDVGPLYLDVSAYVMEPSLEFCMQTSSVESDRGPPITSISLGSTYIGRPVKFPAMIINSSPTPVSFFISLQSEDGTKQDDRESDILVLPSEGTLDPFGKVKISVHFNPTSAQKFKSNLVIDCPELKQSVQATVDGFATNPKLSFSQKSFDFGECSVNDRADLVCTIMNNNDELPVHFELNKIAHFTASPSNVTLLPLRSQDILISFSPRQLGEFFTTISVNVEHGLQRLGIKLHGVAIKEIERMLVAGTDKLPVDFKPTLKYIKPETIHPDLKPKPLGAKPSTKTIFSKSWTQVDLGANSDNVIDSNTYNAAQFQSKSIHRSNYISFMRTNSNIRNEKTKINHRNELISKGLASAPMSELDLGIDFAEGLQPPPLMLPIEDETILESKKSKQAVFDEIHLIRKKFQPRPIAAGEVRECSAVLTPEMLFEIQCGPKIIDFGSVCVRSKTWRNFSVLNGCDQNILANLLFQDIPELRESTPASQTVPPKSIAGFDLCFAPTAVQEFRKTVVYLINECHRFSFYITANVIPVSVNISTETVNFVFTRDNSSFVSTQTLRLTNAVHAIADYIWSSSDPSVTVSPEKGSIEANRSISVKLNYRPKFPLPSSIELYLKVGGGKDKTVFCKVEAVHCPCSISEKKLSLGTIPVGISVEKSITIKNNGSNYTVFQLLEAPRGFKVYPLNGFLDVGASMDIQVSFRPTEEGVGQNTLIFEVRNDASLKCTVTWDAVVPNISILQDELDFGFVTQGMSKIIPLTIDNRGRIAATAYLDFSSLPEFSINLDSNDEENKNPAISKVSTSNIKRINSLDSGNNSAMGNVDDDDECAYMLVIQPSSKLEVFLRWNPVKEQEIEQELPLFLAGISSLPSLRRVLHAATVPARMSVNPASVLDFSTRVVKNSYTLNVTISNEQKEVLQWSFVPQPANAFGRDGQPIIAAAELINVSTAARSKANKPASASKSNSSSQAIPHFRIEPASGYLLPRQTSVVSITFAPNEPWKYELPIKLLLEDQEYSTLLVKGIGAYPSLYFSSAAVYLPSVPLGFISSQRFYLNNDGYESMEFQYSLPSNIPISLKFPSGKILGAGGFEKIPVDISFVSLKPMSFSCIVEFSDTLGAKYCIRVAGTSDNSLLTIQSFLETKKSYKLKCSEDKPPILIENENREEENKEEKSSDAEDSNIVSLKVLMQYLVASRFLLAPISDFPGELIKSNGKFLYELVEFLSGKPTKVPSFPNNKMNKKETIAQLVAAYDSFLSVLKSFGGLVSGIRTEYLLSYPQFTRFIESDRNIDKSLTESSFSHWSFATWSDLIYQIVKIFVLNRISLKQFKVLPGINNTDPVVLAISKEGYLDSSNVFSASEIILMKFVEINFHNAFPTESRAVTNFTSDFKDGLLIIGLLKSYVPSLKSTISVITNASNEEQYRENYCRINEALAEMGFNWNLGADFLLNPVGRDLMLFLLFLYNTLPAYLPKTTIDFCGRLQEEIIKTIELTNPSKKAIVYNVRIEGSNDFSVENREVRLAAKDEPGSKISFPIKLKARFSKAVFGTIYFTSVSLLDTSFVNAEKQKSIPRYVPSQSAATLVFNLQSTITSRKSIAQFTCSSKMYEPSTVDIELLNPFGRDATYFITSTQSPPIIKALESKTSSKKEKGKSAPVSNAKVLNYNLPDAFFCKSDVVKVKSGQKLRVQVQFLPFLLGDYSCSLLFVDDLVGEFLVDITGTGIMPCCSEVIKFSAENRPNISKDLVIPFKNALYEKAKSLVVDRLPVAARSKERDSGKIGVLPSTITYTIEANSPFFTLPQTFDLVDNSKPEEEKKGEKDSSKSKAVKCPVVLAPKGAGTYCCDITFRSIYDIRIYRIEYEINAQPTFATVEFLAPARTKIVQEIPIINGSDKDWSIAAVLNGASYSGPREISVKKKSTANYVLTFSPNWIGEHNGTLVLTNTKSLEKATYELSGVAEEPLAEDSIKLKCKTRKLQEYRFVVKNLETTDCLFNVESDLPFISGASTILVPANSRADYVVQINARLGGNYHGSISFVAPNGKFTWYAVDMEIETAPPEQELEIRTYLRKSSLIELTLSNPMNEPVQFDVIIEGEALFGEPVVNLAPKEVVKYECIFSPLISGTEKGSIRFSSVKAGEFWYILNLVAEKPQPIELSDLNCEIGSTKQTTITIDNPTEFEISMNGILSNNRNFTLLPSSVTVPPFDKAEVLIQYDPSDLEIPQLCDVFFRHPQLGEWMYKIKGVGHIPITSNIVSIATPLGLKINSNVQFRNPFEMQQTFKISLECNSIAKNFTLMLKQTKVTIAPNTVFPIPYIFLPSSMTDCDATINVECIEQPVAWTYLIKGVAESSLGTDPIFLNCKARKRLDTTFELLLPGLGEGKLTQPEEFSFSLGYPKNLTSAPALKRCLSLQLTEPILYSGLDALKFTVAFEPLRPVRTTLDLSVEKKSGGRWRFKLNVEATDPDIDDVIEIQSPIHKTSSVSFRLCNQLATSAKFQSFFSVESAYEFTVSPATGILPAAGQEGASFIVSFTPHEYGKLFVGRLIILTEDMQWTYEVRGSYPPLIVPVPVSAIDNSLSKDVIGKMEANRTATSATNFLKHNAKKIKEVSKALKH